MEKVQIQHFGMTALVDRRLVSTCARKEMIVAVVKSYIEKQKANPDAAAMYDKLIMNATAQIISCNRRLNGKIHFVL